MSWADLTTAIDIAAKKASLDNYRIVELPKLEDPFTQVMKELTGDVRERIIRHELSGSLHRNTVHMKELFEWRPDSGKVAF